MPRVRDFSPAALQEHVSSKLRVGWASKTGFEGPAWQFVIFLPRWVLTFEGRGAISTADDETQLEDHFGGYTVAPSYYQGIGRRGSASETNKHRLITVLASRWRGTWRYFKTLRRELEECTGEEQVLILHQPLWIV